MTCLRLRFTAGRYHATPWGHHVNEGVVEWPPSPWRILRALVAALHADGETANEERGAAWSALLKLTDPPEFALPPAGTGHSRHYLSLNQINRAKTALVIDAFVVIARDSSVVVRWPVALAAHERRALAALVSRVSYLGRAESWCEVELLSGDAGVQANCTPSDGNAAPEMETVRVLCSAGDVTACDLERTTVELRRDGWSDPPGTRWVFYRRAADALRPRTVRRATPSALDRRPSVVELALGGAVLPRLLAAAPLATLVRSAALGQYVAQGHAAHSFNLSGKAPDGLPLRTQHRHAHFVPESRRPDARVTHVTIWAPNGFTAEEVEALAAVRLLNLRNLRLPAQESRDQRERQSDRHVVEDVRDALRARDSSVLRVVVSAMGCEDDFRRTSTLFGWSRHWRSRTPFVLFRHPKRARESAAEQLARELSRRGLPPVEASEPVRGAALATPEGGDELLTRWTEFDVRRNQERPTTPVTGFRLRFARPIAGPLVLGWGCHFGLGVFEPDHEAARELRQASGGGAGPGATV